MVFPHVADEFDEAMTPQTSTFHGQVDVQVYKIAWPKGDFKARQALDANVHKGDGWNTGTMVNLIVTPLDPTRKLIQREIPTFAREWSGVIRPSIEALGEKIAKIRAQDPKAINPLRELHKLWVTGEWVPKPDNKAGETYATLKFTNIWATEAECQADAGQAKNGDDPANHAPQPEPTPGTAPDVQRLALAAFLPALWQQAGRDPAKMTVLLENNPILAGAGFTLHSPEVQAVMK
jgi:hypothetical protein